MPKRSRELSAIEVGRLRSEGAHAVGGVQGLYLHIVGGSRSWVLRYVISARRRRMGLGSFPAVPLAQAKERAREAHKLIDQGVDPIDARDALKKAAAASRARALTFKVACERFIAVKESEWRNPKHRDQWENTLETYAEPIIGHLDVSAIGQDEVLRVLDPIWRTKTETASRLRGRIEQVLDWAKTRGHRTGENPASWRGHLDKLLPKPEKIAKVKHHPAVPLAHVLIAVDAIKAVEGVSARALLFQVLTAGRSGEIRGARWAEFDFGAALWDVPETRMKGKRPHRVPLSTQAIALLESMPRYEETDLVFPGRKLQQLSDMSLTACMRRLDFRDATDRVCVPHGWRSTFRDWAAEHTHYPPEMAEMALAHAIESKVEAAYRRGDMLAKRAAMMQDWADYCIPSPMPPKPKDA
ncbi:integrase arm-type DNA-binding domain-containing protein [Variovorax sp. EL159]|uniref:tyrosine-type recombinase/integrase n=1 Tax=Variovorax sp. EL159 TaxID=1566270 RepID=UPI000B89D821|nr:integrase arm-type DNA-binding domain-containing protein [Variovorax sp. EL159]